MRQGKRRALLAALVVSAVAGGAAGSAVAAAAASARPSFSTDPALAPGFSGDAHNYVVRCLSGPVKVELRIPPGWRGGVGGDMRRRSFSTTRPLREGRALNVVFRRSGGGSARHYHVRCLPADFPDYEFERRRPGGPRFLASTLDRRYVVVFSRDGAPVWWLEPALAPQNPEILADGTIAWVPHPDRATQTGDYEIHGLDGRLRKRVVAAGDALTDMHELQLEPNGNYLIGAQVTTPHVDTSAYGGSPDQTIQEAEIQELTPKGGLVWKWDAADHIDLSETGRWWPIISGATNRGDVVHFNSAQRLGNEVILSFRHLDAVYAVSHRTGRIIWKLGGTTTARSLAVANDPNGDYPFGGQHDARLHRDGTLTLFDDETQLGRTPRAVRYRIDQAAGTARLLEAVSDPAVRTVGCCGSARRAKDGSWLVDWGGMINGGDAGYVAGYRPSGHLAFALRDANNFTYRANPVPAGAVTARQLRRGMNEMAR